MYGRGVESFCGDKREGYGHLVRCLHTEQPALLLAIVALVYYLK